MQKLITILLTMLLLGACATAPKVTEQDKKVDPFQSWNYQVFRFNNVLDKYFLRPVAVSYRWITPDPIEIGVSNFFSNIADVPDAVNALLQWKPKKSGLSLSRFMINTVLGVGGLFDVASKMGIANDGDDFGETLGYWGVPSGPYIVLPLLGPSNVRDGIALIPNSYLSPLAYWPDDVPARNSLWALRVVDVRAGLLDFDELISGDKYRFMRDAYMQRRASLVSDGQLEDSFGDDVEDDDWLSEEF